MVFSVGYVSLILVIALPYRNVSLPLRSEEAAARSPLSSSLVELVNANVVFRAFGNVDHALINVLVALERHIWLSYNLHIVSSWVAFRVLLLSGMAATCLCLSVGQSTIRSPPFVGII